MLDLRLRCEAAGLFRVASKNDFDLASEVEVGEMVRAKLFKARTLNQNNLLHALCEAAFDNHRGGPRPEEVPTWRHMKSWLLIEAGHCDVKRFRRGSMTPEVAKHLRQQVDTVHFTVSNKTGEILMKTARRTRNLSRDDMGELIDRVEAIIRAEVVPGVERDQLLNMARSKAA